MPSKDMKIAHCARCRGLFVRIRFEVCDRCLDDEEADYTRINDVLVSNKGLTVEQVAEKAEVTTACVLRMLERGLIVNEKIAENIKCGRCGAPAISASQQLCTACLQDLDKKFISEINQAKKNVAQQHNESVHEVLNEKRKQVPNSKKK